jgi:hypothetical protein
LHETALAYGEGHFFAEGGLDDPAAAGYFVFLIEDGGLAGGDGALGLVEEGADLVVVDAGEGGHCGDVAVADLDADADGFGELGDGYPVEAVGEEVARHEIGVGANGDLVGVGVDVEDVEGLGAGEAEALALTDGEGVDAGVVADDFAGGGDEFAGGVGEGFALLVEVGLEEGVVVAAGDEADLLGVWLGGYVEAGFGGHDADGGLVHLAEGEEGAGELLLREAEEEVGLVLGLVGGAGENPTVADGVEVIAGVMAGGDAVCPDLAGGCEELIELEVVVAEGAGDGGASGEVFRDEGLDDFGFEAVLLVDEVVGDVELLGYAAGVVDVVDGAAASLDGLGHAFVAGEAALVPELEGEADEVMALGAQECRDGGGVYASGHGYGDGFWLRHC